VSTSDSPLTIALILGSTRVAGHAAPLLGPRVGLWLAAEIRAHGGSSPTFAVDVVDCAAERLPLLETPHFGYRRGKAPPALESLAARLAAADGYVLLTPEYNHAPSPALLNLLNHFGSSLFSFKPSAIASYSAGQWGGVRAAHSLRAPLSELGCLPVSAMIHVANAGEAFHADGVPNGGGTDDGAVAARWCKYAARTLSQLEWWAAAARAQRAIADPRVESPAFARAPSERNAP